MDAILKLFLFSHYAMQYVSMYTIATKVQDDMRHLIHQTSLSITISVLPGVQFVHQAWLLASCILNARVSTSGTSCTSASSSEVLIGVVSMSGGIILSQRGSSSSASATESPAN